MGGVLSDIAHVAMKAVFSGKVFLFYGIIAQVIKNIK
jgi:hypothetical protein